METRIGGHEVRAAVRTDYVALALHISWEWSVANAIDDPHVGQYTGRDRL